MHHVAALVERYFSSKNGELCFDGVPVSHIAEKYGTPLFVYDRRALELKWNAIRSALPEEFAISYSVKANPNGTVLRYYLSKGCGVEVASGGEFYQARAVGCWPGKIIFAGPGKTLGELKYVLEEEIGEIHLESLNEIDRVATISESLGIRARVALRINPTGEAQGGAMRMGGKPAPFGIDEEILDVALDRVLSSPRLIFRGIHLFAGTQILDHAILLDQYRKGVQIAERVATRLGEPIQTLDFGGGLGVPYFPNEHSLDLSGLREGVLSLIEEIRREPRLKGTRFMVEPGRFLVGEAGVYVTRVNDIKVSRGKKFLITDGGMHHHLAASGNLGQTIKRNYPIALVNRLDLSAKETVDVVGPLCTPLDVLARGVELPAAEVGDLIGVFQSGAYARTASPLGFLSHPTPPEVWVENSRDHLIRRRGTYHDSMDDLVDP